MWSTKTGQFGFWEVTPPRFFHFHHQWNIVTIHHGDCQFDTLLFYWSNYRDLTSPHIVAEEGEISWFQVNLGWWNILCWPEILAMKPQHVFVHLFVRLYHPLGGGVIGLESLRTILSQGQLNLNNEKNPSCLGYIEDYTKQLLYMGIIINYHCKDPY